jgi:WD40 repeat protein
MKILFVGWMGVFFVTSAAQVRRPRSPSAANTVVLYRTIRITGNDEANAVSFSPDGKMLAAALGDGTVRIWAVGDGRLLRSFKAATRAMKVRFSPDGSLLATSNMGPISLWRVSDYQLLKTLSAADGKEEFLNDFTFSPDGQFVTAITSQATTLWRVSDGTLARTIARGGYSSAEYSKGGFSVAFAPDGQTLFTDGRRIKRWRISDGRLLGFLARNEDYDRLSLSQNGETLAIAGYGAIDLLRSNDGQTICTLREKDMFGQAESVSFSPNGNVLASSNLGGNDWRNGTTDDKKIRLWNVKECRLLHSIPKISNSYYRDLAFSPDGTL